MPKKITEYPLLPLFRKYINEIKKGLHVQNSGKRITTGSIDNYLCLEKLLNDFKLQKNFNLRFKILNLSNKKQFTEEQNYWKFFYKEFSNYLYDDLGHFDNYVGMMTKLLRAFFNYLITQKGLAIGSFHKNFFTPGEEIEIIILSPERVNYLAHSIELEKKLKPELKPVKDIFVFGCAVALRFSDLMSLNPANIELNNGRTYLKVLSKKTQTYTRVKLPVYAVNILNRYQKRYKTRLLPKYNKGLLNKKIKLVMQEAGFTEPINRTRQKRGVPTKVFKNVQSKETYRFCDAITTHSMRRTAITNMLSLGMNELAVRKISGHAANSKEFYRYVSFAQAYMDSEIDMMHDKMDKKRLEIDAEI